MQELRKKNTTKAAAGHSTRYAKRQCICCKKQSKTLRADYGILALARHINCLISWAKTYSKIRLRSATEQGTGTWARLNKRIVVGLSTETVAGLDRQLTEEHSTRPTAGYGT